MLKYAFESDKEDYEVLYAFDGEMHNGQQTYSYVIRDRYANKLALLENCMYLDMEWFTDEDFDACAPLASDYTQKP